MARILIIDDSEEFRKVFRLLLEDAGYEVAEACDGDEGIKVYEQQPADLVVSDVIMPGKEGVQMMVELKRKYPEIKIFAMSGGGIEEPNGYLESARVVGGALRTFAKPFSFKEMLAAIKEELEGK